MILRIILSSDHMKGPSFSPNIFYLTLSLWLSLLALPAFAGAGTGTLSDSSNQPSSAANTRYGPFGVPTPGANMVSELSRSRS